MGVAPFLLATGLTNVVTKYGYPRTTVPAQSADSRWRKKPILPKLAASSSGSKGWGATTLKKLSERIQQLTRWDMREPR